MAVGREIRRVPKDWQHPRDEEGGFKPLYDEDYQSACRKWWADAMAHHNAETFCPESEERADGGMNEWWWDWDGPPPSEASYRPAFTEPADHYQIYETVTEGTPCSPVFSSLDEMANWMCLPIDRSSEYNDGADWQCMQGRTKEQALLFITKSSTFSFVVIPGRGIVDGVAALSEMYQ